MGNRSSVYIVKYGGPQTPAMKVGKKKFSVTNTGYITANTKCTITKRIMFYTFTVVKINKYIYAFQ